jgi:predicted nucleotide-binding protein (sugar kinase/HSP70/actin superfamily)
LLRRIDGIDSPSELVKLRMAIHGEFEAIDVDRSRTPLRIRVLGESFCVLEPFINQNALERLGEMGVWVDPYLTTHRWLGFHGLRIGQRRRQQLLQPARRYWRYNVGGEDENVVAYLLDAARKGYDGALHLHPFACMPGTVVGPTLSQISREHNIPLLDISLDEQTAEAGFYTRVEAFLSVLEKRRRRRSGTG